MKTILTIFAAMLFLFGLPCLLGSGFAPIVGAILTAAAILLLAAIAILGKVDALLAVAKFERNSERV